MRAGVMQLGAVIGLLLAMPLALSSSHVPNSCAAPGRCVAEAVTNALVSMVLCAGAGVLVGMIVAVLLCLTVPGLKRRDL